MSAFIGTQLASDPFGETFAVAGRGGREVRFRRLASAFAAQDGFADLLLSHRDPILALAHPHLVTTVAIARDGKGRLIVAEGLPSGPSLADCLELAARSSRPLGADLVIYLARALVSGLAHLHGAGLVHGLVHPRSVYLDPGGGVRLGDIAVAHAVAVAILDAPELCTLAEDELAPADSWHPVDARLDVHRTGALLAMLKSASADPDAIARLAEVTQRATAADPRERHADAGELLAHLGELFDPAVDDEAARQELAVLVAEANAAARAADAHALPRALTDPGDLAAQVDDLDEDDDLARPAVSARPAAPTVERASVPDPGSGLLARVRALPRASLVLIAAELVVALLLVIGLTRPDPPPAPAPAAGELLIAAPAADPVPAAAPRPMAPAADDPRCVLDVRSTPPDATVTVDGITAGVTPLSVVGLRCDRTVTVTVDKVGFDSWRRKVELVGGEPFHLRAELERPRVTVRVASTPAGAQVAINGKPVGKTPLAVELNAAAEAALVLQMTGYRPFRTTLVPSRQRELAAELVPVRRAGAGGRARAMSPGTRPRGATAPRPTK